jgi:serine/threonine protein kinase
MTEPREQPAPCTDTGSPAVDSTQPGPSLVAPSDTTLAAHAAAVQADLRRRWRQGQPALVEEYFLACPALGEQRNLALDLIYAEVVVREELHDAPKLDEYLCRFPQFAEELKVQFEVHRAIERGLGSRSGVSPRSPSAASRPAEFGHWPELPNYRIVRELGHGGMGVVYEAYDLKRNETVALKTMQLVSPAALYRFKQEFRLLADVAHPGLVALYELVSTGNVWFFTMELVDGANFLAYVRDQTALPQGTAAAHRPPTQGPLLPEAPCPDTQPYHPDNSAGAAGKALDVDAREPFGLTPMQLARLRAALRKLAEAVTALHAAGRLHCDIKPTNVLVTRLGRVVLLDFGLATELTRSPLAATGEAAFGGTLAYMAPEQEACQPLSAASDWYSVGVMLYEALTGYLPFRVPGKDMVRDRQITEPLPPAELVRGLPDDLNQLCVRLLRRWPQDRITGAEVLRVLDSPDNAEQGTAAPAPYPGSDDVPFVGRDEQLSVLRDAYTTMRQGQTVVVYVHGRSGLGKTALVERFLGTLLEQGATTVLAGRCYERESVPYKLLDNLIDALSRHLKSLPAATVEPLLPPDMLALARVFPVLRRVDAVARMPEPSDLVEPHEMRRRAFAALRELLTRLARRRPLVLFIDDLQWGDVDSAALVTSLLQPPDAPPLLLISSYRSEEAQNSPALQALLQAVPAPNTNFLWRQLAVEPLGSEAAARLATELLGPAWPDVATAAASIAREAQGNPFFVYELVQHMRGGAGLAHPAESGGSIALDEVLWQRVQRLPAEARQLLDAVAVAGRPIPQDTAGQAADLLAGARVALALLRSAHLIRHTTSDRAEVETFHDRVRETVVARLSVDRLRGQHQRLAIAFEAGGRADPEVLAIHFHGAGDRARASSYYARGGDQAAETLAFNRAVKLYSLALELSAADGAKQPVRVKLGDALANAGRGADAADAWLGAAQGSKPAEAAELQRRAAMHRLMAGHIDDGLDTLQTVLRTTGMKLAASPRWAIGPVLLRRLLVWLRGTRFRERSAEQVSHRLLREIDVCWSVSAGLTMADTIRAADFQTRGLLLALRAGEPYRIARALAWEAPHMATLGRWGERGAKRWQQQAEAIARRIDQPHALGLAIVAGGICAFFAGRWKAAHERCEAGEAILREQCTGVFWELATARSFSLWALFFMGDVAQINERLPRLVQEARERGDLLAEANLVTFGGPLALLARGDPRGARQSLIEVMDRWSQQGFHVQHFTSLSSHTQIDLYQGDASSAWERMTRSWRALQGSLLLQVEAVRIFMLHLRARCALACAATAVKPQLFLRYAEADARRLEREKAQWSWPLAALIRAALAAAGGQPEIAASLLTRAADDFNRRDMGLFAAAAQRRAGEVRGGDEGRALIASADTWMAKQNIADPAAMTNLHVPFVKLT